MGSYCVQTRAGPGTRGVTGGDGNGARQSRPGGLAVIGTGRGASLHVADRVCHSARRAAAPGGARHGGMSTGVAALRMVGRDAEPPSRAAWTKTMAASPGAWTTDLQSPVLNGVSGCSLFATVEARSSMTNLPPLLRGTRDGPSSTSRAVWGRSGGRGESWQSQPPCSAPSAPSPARACALSSRIPYRDRVRCIDGDRYAGVWHRSFPGSAVRTGSPGAVRFAGRRGARAGRRPDRHRRPPHPPRVAHPAGQNRGRRARADATTAPGSAPRIPNPRGVAVTADRSASPTGPPAP